MEKFRLKSSFSPCGDQPRAIEQLAKKLLAGDREATLLGVTGSGKTFTVANVIERLQRPVLVISHNKTLAAQLYREFTEFFPENAVEYFVSYYDYYQPEAYIPHTDTYIEKDASINEQLDKLRLRATSSLMCRDDVIIVASVSCIYNLGSPEEYSELLVFLEEKQQVSMDAVLHRLVAIQYERNDVDFSRGRLRVRGDILDIFPAYSDYAYRVEFWGNAIETVKKMNPVTGEAVSREKRVAVYPAKHFVTSAGKIEGAVATIREELKERLAELRAQNKLLEAQRLEGRTNYDIEMLKEMGYCHGVENYSRHLSGRPPGARPSTLIDYFQKDFLTVIDESHVTLPQLRGMYNGDRARKEVLVEYGFRLPSCLDNRPLRFEEFDGVVGQIIYVSATPGDYEFSRSGPPAEQVIRPTGLVDPEIIVKPSENQIDDLAGLIRQRARNNERVLVTTLTKRMAEDLAEYLSEAGLRVRYIHSEIDAIERVEILRALRLKEFDCIVGINLLREGLDLPEVSLVAILDADKEGFLRSATSLIQVSGRTARNVNGQVVMYADRITSSMKKAIDETNRRRDLQLQHNREHNISPKSIQKSVQAGLQDYEEARRVVISSVNESEEEYEAHNLISELEAEMDLCARNLQFEKAIELRDQIEALKSGALEVAGVTRPSRRKPGRRKARR